MDVSGVRSACVTASSRAVRNCSPWRAASVCPSCSTARACAIAMATKRRNGLQGLQRKRPAGNSQAANRAHAEADRNETEAVGRIDHGFLARHHRLQTVGIEAGNHGSGPVYLLLVGKKERGRSHFEGLYDLRGDAIQQFHHVARFEKIPAEGIQLLDIPLPRGSFLRLLAARAWPDGCR